MTEILIGLVGDLLVNRDNPPEVFKEVRAALRTPHVLFGNLESAYTDHPSAAPGALYAVSAPVRNLDAYVDAGFDVLSLANNHIIDVGYEAMLDTRARLRAHGIKTCGAGDSLKDARAPAIVDAEGLRVAFLAYACIFPKGHEARADAPGLVPVRAYNFWREAHPNMHAPGLAPLAATIPDETDLANLVSDIQQARQQADIVITSFHWGDHTRPFHLTDHETRTARYCIDHGADMVVGHHHHALRGMEWYAGKPIIYGLGHFVFDLRMEWNEEEFRKQLAAWDPSGYFDQVQFLPGPRKGWPLLPMHEDTRMTVLAWATANREGVTNIGFLPCRLTPDGLVHPLRLDSGESREVVSYIDKCNKSQKLNARLEADGIEVAGFSTIRVTAPYPDRRT